MIVESGAPREVLEQEAVQVIAVARRDRAALLEQMDDRHARGRGGRFERLVLDGVLVGRVEQFVQLVAEGLGQLEVREALDERGLRLGLQTLALDARERGLQRIGRCGPVATAALLVEVHRRAVQPQQQPRGLDRGRGMTEVVATEREIVELVLRGDFPEEAGIDVRREGLRRLGERNGCRPLEAHHHGVRLELDALAVGRLDLERSGVVGEDGASLEAAVLFVENVHGNPAGW